MTWFPTVQALKGMWSILSPGLDQTDADFVARFVKIPGIQEFPRWKQLAICAKLKYLSRVLLSGSHDASLT